MEPMTGMLAQASDPKAKQNIFMMQRMYRVYAEDAITNGQQPLPFDQWLVRRKQGMLPA